VTTLTLGLLLAGLQGAPDYQLRILANGLTVLVVEDHALPLVTVEIGVRNGSMNEPPELNGLSHLYEHMFFKGNKALPNQEAFLEKTRELGMVFNGSTETEQVNYFFTTTSDKLLPSLTLMRDSIETPLFDPEELKREQQVVIGEIDRDDADPFYHFSHELDLAMWKYPTFKDPLGDRKTVASSTVEKMRLIQGRYYLPNNSVLVIAGDVDPEKAFGLATALLEGWEKGPDPFLIHPVIDEPPLQRSRVVVVLQPVQSVSLGFQWHGPSAKGAELTETYAADLLSAIVGQSGSRFQRDLVDSGACVRADFGWYTQAHVGPISYGLEAAPEKVDACVEAAVRELPQLAAADAFTDQEMRNAATQLEVRKAMEREATSSFAHLLTFFWSSTGLPYYDGYLDHLRAVRRDQIQGFLRRYVLGAESRNDRAPFVFGALLSPELSSSAHLDVHHFERLLGLAPPPPRAISQRGAGR
jgi:zinc protease